MVGSAWRDGGGEKPRPEESFGGKGSGSRGRLSPPSGRALGGSAEGSGCSWGQKGVPRAWQGPREAEAASSKGEARSPQGPRPRDSSAVCANLAGEEGAAQVRLSEAREEDKGGVCALWGAQIGRAACRERVSSPV